MESPIIANHRERQEKLERIADELEQLMLRTRELLDDMADDESEE